MIAFEPLRREHLALLRAWLSREHVRRWWGKSLAHARTRWPAGINPCTT